MIRIVNRVATGYHIQLKDGSQEFLPATYHDRRHHDRSKWSTHVGSVDIENDQVTADMMRRANRREIELVQLEGVVEVETVATHEELPAEVVDEMPGGELDQNFETAPSE
jgi:hypothetical protein